jgi:hypothetical protein
VGINRNGKTFFQEHVLKVGTTQTPLFGAYGAGKYLVFPQILPF